MPFLALLGSPLARAFLIAFALVFVVGAYTEHERHIGAAKLLAKEKAKTEQEHQRRLKVEEAAQSQAKADADRILNQERQNASLLSRINELSRRHDHDRCLDADSVRRLNEAGHPAGR